MYICKLFDGKSSHEYAATVILQGSGFSVDYTNREGEHQHHNWKYEDIYSVDMPWAGFISLKVGPYPQQVLETNDQGFIKEFKAVNGRQIPLYQRMIDQLGMNRAVLFSLIGVVGILVTTYFWLIPLMAVKAADHFPVSYEKQLGENILKSTMQWGEKDSARTVLVNTFVRQLSLSSDYSIEVTVVKSGVVNAYAVPGGNIVIYTGLLDKLNNAEQLAALLGHEISHIEQKHSLKSIFKSIAGYMTISLILGDVNGMTAVLAEHANNLDNLSYSRSLEQEADKEGMNIMIANNIDPQGMVGLMEVLEESHGDQVIPEFLSSHPVTGHRLAYAEEYISQYEETFPAHSALERLFADLQALSEQNLP